MDRPRLVREIKSKGLACGGSALEVVRSLGGGGNGVALLCRTEDGAERVAKVYVPPDRRDADDMALKRFKNEISLTTKLTHPNLVRAHGSGTVALGAYALPFYLMERASATLRVRIREQAGLSALEENLRTFVRISLGVAFLHNNGIVHRDLKPENVLINDFGQPLVADLGIAHVNPQFVSHSVLTVKGERLLNQDYYAPEQRFGAVDAVDHRADIYALGCILYELLLGTPPVRHNSPPVTSLDAALTPLSGVIDRMTAYDRDDRYFAVEDVIEELSVAIGWGLATVRGATPVQASDVEAMSKLLRSSNSLQRDRGIKMARNFGVDALPTLHQLTGHGRREVRNAVALALGQIRDPESIPYLVGGTFGNSRKRSTFRPSTDTAAEALAMYPVEERIRACGLISHSVTTDQVLTILNGIAADEAYAAAEALIERDLLLVDEWSESGVSLLLAIDEERAWPLVRKVIATAEGYKVRHLLPLLSDLHRVDAIDQWLDTGIRYFWYLENMIDATQTIHDRASRERLLLRIKKSVLETSNAKDRPRLLKQIQDALTPAVSVSAT